MTSTANEDLSRRMTEAVEDAAPGVRARPEWKELDQFLRSLAEVEGGLDLDGDQVRGAEAMLDLLDLARAEVEHSLLVEHESRTARLAEDERLLVALADECRVYVGLILLGLFFPPLLLLMPFGALLVFGALPSVYGFNRMRTVSQPTTGRVWLVLQDRVETTLSRVRLLHGAAIASLVLTGVWALVEILSEQLAQR
jgi:hypothetical protein